MKITINFVDSRVKVFSDAKECAYHLDQNGTLCLSVITVTGIETFYASTVASVNYDIQKPQLNVTSVFIW